AEGRWPARELAALAGYLRAEVLRQAGDEEWLLFPARPAPDFARLERDHERLRAGTEVLEQAAAGGGMHSRAQVAAVTRDILAQLRDHLAAEEQVLAAAEPDQVPATTEPGSRQHGWYPLTEAPVIDLDSIPAGEKTDAAVARLVRLHGGEQVELRSARDTVIEAVWRRADQISPGDWGFAYLQDGPARWRVQVTRRPATRPAPIQPPHAPHQDRAVPGFRERTPDDRPRA
nr:hemerythrin domain-containing protein [Actinomycetota bacterium]